MNLVNFLFLSMTIFFLAACSTAPLETKLCPKIFIHSKENFVLTETEKRLVCGDEEDPAYKVIPSYQASYMLTGFFQSRGYSTPRFEYAGDLLHVHTGEKSFVKEVVAVSESIADSQLVEKEILRKYKGEPITPKLLDAVEKTSLTLLRNNTFPCAKVESTVDASMGTITIKMMNLIPFQFGKIHKSVIEELESTAFDRFYPFEATDYFSEKKLILTEKRFLRAGVVQGTYFQESCNLEKKPEPIFSLAQQFILGKSRTIRLGIGASTEVGPMGRAKWSNQRSGRMASLLEANLQVSAKNQYFSFLSDRYLWKDAPRRSFLTSFEVERDDQTTFEETNAKLKPHLQWTRDTQSRFWTWTTGPTLIAGVYKTNANDGDTRRISTGALEGMIQTKTHDYEIFDMHPEEGNFTQLNFDFRHPSFGFIDPLLKLNFSYLTLHRVGDFGKGSAILGFRTNAATTWVPDDILISSLPPSVKFYGGGSDDVRGFNLNSLPDNNGLGALTKLSFKFEFRKTYLWISSLESFTFVDTVYFGKKSWDLENRIWYSPGTGLRWMSPIGLVQGYVARSLSSREIKDDGNFFYLGLGGVF